METLKDLLGALYTPEIAAKIGDKKFIEDDGSSAEVEKLKGTIKERDGQLEALKNASGNSADLQAEITKLQNENKTAAEKYADDLKKTKFDYAIDAALTKAGAVNAKAVKALLDLSKISLDGDNLVGYDEQIKSIKEAEKWAFGSSASVAGAGGNPVGETKNADYDKYADGAAF